MQVRYDGQVQCVFVKWSTQLRKINLCCQGWHQQENNNYFYLPLLFFCPLRLPRFILLDTKKMTNQILNIPVLHLMLTQIVCVCVFLIV